MKPMKGKVEFEGKTYWINLWVDPDNKVEIEVLDNGAWRSVLKSEVDIFDLLERGKIVSDTK